MAEQGPPRDPIAVGRYRPLDWTDDHVRRFWEYESQFPENYFSYGYRDKLVPRLRGMLDGKKRVLDFGCGGGFLIPALSRVAGEVYGVDFSPTSVELTKERSAHISNFKGAYAPHEAVEMGLKFDGILSVEVIEHLTDEQLESTANLIKQLAVGGSHGPSPRVVPFPLSVLSLSCAVSTRAADCQ